MTTYDKHRDRWVGHDYPGIHGGGMHQFMMDEMELGGRVAVALDDPDQAWWELHAGEVAQGWETVL